MAALQQNGDAFISVHSDQDPAYQTIRLQNLRIRSSDADLRFVYTMRYDNEGLYFVVDATNPGEAGASAFGDRYSSPGPVLAANYKTINKTLAETTFYTDEYGTFPFLLMHHSIPAKANLQALSPQISPPRQY